ncbi:MAG: hypothetical protein ACRDCS_07985 [Tannerellaceae bacterium]
MDSLGDWLYIVLIVLGGIVSFLAENKKKKAAKSPIPSAKPADEAHTTEWDVFQEQSRPKRSYRKVDTSNTVTNSSTIFSSNQRDATLEEKAMKSEKDTLLRRDTTPDMTEADDECAERIELSNAEELRKAVIYSEILKRKEY